MNRVQELIDEHKEQLPTGLAKDLLEACRDEYESKPKLCRVTATRIKGVGFLDHSDDGCEAEVKLETLTQTLIMECLSADAFCKAQRGGTSVLDLFEKGIMHEGWLTRTLPFKVRGVLEDQMWIVHAIEPFVPKRARE